MARKKKQEFIRVRVRKDIVIAATPILEARGATIEQAVEIHLRKFAKQNEPPLGLGSLMNFGQYRDAPVEQVARIDSGYILWIHEQDPGKRFDAEVVSLANYNAAIERTAFPETES